MSTFQDRPYQVAANAAIARMFGETHRLLGVLPTGGGKTIVFARECRRRLALGQRTLILAHRDKLVRQAADKVSSVTGTPVEIEKAEERASLSAHIVSGSVQSLCREKRLSRWPSDHFNLIICDEAHHALSDSWQSVLAHFKSAQVLGVTATPHRGDKRELGAFFEAIAFEEFLFNRDGKAGLVESGFLCPISVQSVSLQIDISKVGVSYDAEAGCKDFGKQALSDAIVPYLGQVAKAIKIHAQHRRTLVFNVLIDTSKKFVDACQAIGIDARHVDGEMPDRGEVIEAFERGDFPVLSNAMLLTEGWDVNSEPTGIGVDCVVVLRPTKSQPLYAQMVGRGTRLAGWKTDLLLLDFLWMHERHAIVRPAHLIAATEEEALAMTKLAEVATAGLPADVAMQMPLELKGLQGMATAQREEALLQKLAEQAKKRGKFISAEEFAMQHQSLAVAEYEPVLKWEFDPVSEKQAKCLRRAGIDVDTVKGKGHASKLLDIHFRGQPLQLASAGQRQKMKQMGCENWETATPAEAGQFFARLRKP